MSKEREIRQYTLDEKTYHSLELQFKRDYVYNMVLAKLLEDFKET